MSARGRGNRMNKREMLHTLIDKIMDIEESSKKGVRISYSNSLANIYFKESDSKGDFIGTTSSIYFDMSEIDKQFSNALSEIEKIKNTPDVEPKVSVLLTEEKARELGLIA